MPDPDMVLTRKHVKLTGFHHVNIGARAFNSNLERLNLNRRTSRLPYSKPDFMIQWQLQKPSSGL